MLDLFSQYTGVLWHRGEKHTDLQYLERKQSFNFVLLLTLEDEYSQLDQPDSVYENLQSTH